MEEAYCQSPGTVWAQNRLFLFLNGEFCLICNYSLASEAKGTWTPTLLAPCKCLGVLQDLEEQFLSLSLTLGLAEVPSLVK